MERLTENEAIKKIQYRINTASEIVGKGADGKAFEDLELAIKALEEVEQFRAIGTVEEFKALKEKEERFDRNIKMFNEIGLEIRNKAIDEFFEEIQKYEDDDMWLRLKVSSIYEIAEQMKAGGENE